MVDSSPHQGAKPLIVQKFGGSTIGKPELLPAIIERIRRRVNQGFRVIAVVSAMGRKSDPYATETLLSLLPSEKRFVCRRESDLLLSCGETISAVLLACRLREAGIPAIARTGFETGIITNQDHGNARIKKIDTRRLTLDFNVFPVVVVTGFQGISEHGHITTLGRGGSDTSAVALAIAFDAEKIEIFTDTSGIFSGDPREIQKAEFLREIRLEDVRQMAWSGAKVLHPRAAELAVQHAMNITVGKVDEPHVSTKIHADSVHLEADRMITAISHGPPVAQFSIDLPGDAAQETATHIFEWIAGAGISMDMFTITESLLRFTVPRDLAYVARKILSEKKQNFHVRENCVKVSIIGAGMHGMKGIMARFFRCLLNRNIPVLQTVDSHATISALIPLTSSGEAQTALHREFIEEQSLSQNSH